MPPGHLGFRQTADLALNQRVGVDLGMLRGRYSVERYVLCNRVQYAAAPSTARPLSTVASSSLTTFCTEWRTQAVQRTCKQ